MLYRKVYIERYRQYCVHTHQHSSTLNQEIPLILHSQDSDAFDRQEENIFSFLVYLHYIQMRQSPLRPGLLLPNIDGVPSGQGKCILRNASLGKKQKNTQLYNITKNYTLIKLSTKGDQTMVTSSTQILAFLNN